MKRVRWGHEAAVERFAWMAREGHLTDAERSRIADAANEARERIAAGRERKAALSPDYGGDKQAVAIAEAVEAA